MPINNVKYLTIHEPGKNSAGRDLPKSLNSGTARAGPISGISIPQKKPAAVAAGRLRRRAPKGSALERR